MIIFAPKVQEITSSATSNIPRVHAPGPSCRLACPFGPALIYTACYALLDTCGTLVPEVFLEFSLLELWGPRSVDRYYDITSREAATAKNEVFLSRRFATRNIVTSIAASRLSHLRRRKSRKTSGTRVHLWKLLLRTLIRHRDHKDQETAPWRLHCTLTNHC